MGNKIKIAFIGVGYMAREQIKVCVDVYLLGICSRTKIKSYPAGQ